MMTSVKDSKFYRIWNSEKGNYSEAIPEAQLALLGSVSLLL